MFIHVSTGNIVLNMVLNFTVIVFNHDLNRFCSLPAEHNVRFMVVVRVGKNVGGSRGHKISHVIMVSFKFQ